MTKRTLNKVLTLLSKTKIDEPDRYLIDAYLVNYLDYEGSYWNENGVCIDREWTLELKLIQSDLGDDIILDHRAQGLGDVEFMALEKAVRDQGLECDVYPCNSGDYTIIEID